MCLRFHCDLKHKSAHTCLLSTCSCEFWPLVQGFYNCPTLSHRFKKVCISSLSQSLQSLFTHRSAAFILSSCSSLLYLCNCVPQHPGSCFWGTAGGSWRRTPECWPPPSRPGPPSLQSARNKTRVIIRTHSQLRYHPSVHPSISSYLHLSEFLSHGLVLSLHLYHLLCHLLHLDVQLSIGPQQVLVVHQQAAHLIPSQRDIYRTVTCQI